MAKAVLIDRSQEYSSVSEISRELLGLGCSSVTALPSALDHPHISNSPRSLKHRMSLDESQPNEENASYVPKRSQFKKKALGWRSRAKVKCTETSTKEETSRSMENARQNFEKSNRLPPRCQPVLELVTVSNRLFPVVDEDDSDCQ